MIERIKMIATELKTIHDNLNDTKGKYFDTYNASINFSSLDVYDDYNHQLQQLSNAINDLVEVAEGL